LYIGSRHPALLLNVALECGWKQALHVMKLLLLYFSVLSQSHVKLLGLETGGVSA
jgi:hypothetical protein